MKKKKETIGLVTMGGEKKVQSSAFALRKKRAKNGIF